MGESSLRQPEWYVSSVSGNNRNTGLSGSPIRDLDELNRRYGQGTAWIRQATTIHVMDTPLGYPYLDVGVVDGASLTMVGTTTVAKSGTFSAVTAQNRTTQTPTSVTGGTLGAADLGKIIRIPSGARAGAYARVLKDNTGNSVRTSPWATFVASEASFPTFVTPQTGDAFEVLNLITLSLSTIKVRSGSSQSIAVGPPLTNCFVVDSLLIDGGSNSKGTVVTEDIRTFFARTVLKALAVSSVPGGSGQQIVCGGGIEGVIAYAGNYVWHGVGVVSPVSAWEFAGARPGAILTMRDDCTFQDSGMVLSRANVFSTGTAFFDRITHPDAACAVSQGSTWIQTGAVADWGTNNAGHGVSVLSGCQYLYTTKPRINDGLGTGREAKVGNVSVLYADLPFVNADNLAVCTVDQ
jgi:hypothetical protein